MPKIVRIRNLVEEKNLNDVVFPVDKQSYLANAQQVGIQDLKDYILSGFTGSGSGGTSGTSGVDGADAPSPCFSTLSNSIRIDLPCLFTAEIECLAMYCTLEGVIEHSNDMITWYSC